MTATVFTTHHHHMKKDIVFQIVNWYATDVVCEDDSDDGGQQGEDMHRYCIKLFGVDETGASVSCTVTDFQPHFYIKLNERLSESRQRSFRTFILSRLPESLSNMHFETCMTSKKDFWGFTNNTKFPFLRLQFQNHRCMKSVARVLSKLPEYKNKVYESNIEPFIRFAHMRNISPSGWVKLPVGKHYPNDILLSTCATDVRISWSAVEPVEREDIAPLLIASFDLECTSSDGDFPVAIKDYTKLATDIFNIKLDCENRKHYDAYETSKAVVQYLCDQYDQKLVLTKEPFDTSKLSQIMAPHLDYMFCILNRDKDVMQREFTKEVGECFTKSVPGVSEDIVRFYNKMRDEGKTQTLMRKSLTTFLTNIFKKHWNLFDRSRDEEECIEVLLRLLFCDKDGVIYALTKYMNDTLPALKGDEIIQIGTTFHRYGEVECAKKVIITLGSCDDLDCEGIDVIQCNTEEELLLEWTDLINQTDPDILTGWNIFGFDFSYAHERAIELGCSASFRQLGRLRGEACEYKQAKLSSSALGDNLLCYLDIQGRTSVDLMKVVQREHKLDSYKLDSVANHFLKMNKHDVSPQDIFNLYKGTSKDRGVIAKYCIQDCSLCNKLIMKLEIVANNVGMSNVCSVPMAWIFMRGQGVKIFSLVAKECKKEGFLIPFRKVNQDEIDEEESYEGAIVLEPKTGIYIDSPISVLDYASLYPASMISENMSPDSIVLNSEYDNLPGITYQSISYDVFEQEGEDKKKVERTCRFVQPPNDEKGIIPNILKNLLKQRKLTRKRIVHKEVTTKDGTKHIGIYNQKTTTITDANGISRTINENDIVDVRDAYNNFQKAVLDGLQLAYKITANSLYGFMGAKTSPIYMKDIAACTTAVGRKMILLAKDFVEKNYNGEVVYGDTDSLFIKFPTNDDQGHPLKGRDALAKCREIGMDCSDKIKPLLKPPHDLEWEKMFWPFILFSKKRYVANKYEHDLDKCKQVSMGIVLKRRDNAQIVKHIYGGVLDIIMNRHDVQASIKFLKKSMDDLVNGRFPLEDLVITKTLKARYKDPDKIAHKVLADRIKERSPGSAPQANDRIPYVYVQVEDGKKVLQGERIEHPDFIKEKNLKPDYEFYLTHQIMNPILQLFAIMLEQLDGYKAANYNWEKEKSKLKAEGRNEKFIRDKIAELRELAVKEILFNDVLRRIKNRKTGQTEITSFYKVA